MAAPLIFGLRVPPWKLAICARQLAERKLPISTVARNAGMGTSSVRRFAEAARIQIKDPYAERKSKYADLYRALRDARRRHQKQVIVPSFDPAKDRNRVSSILRTHKEFGRFRWSVRVSGVNELSIVNLGKWEGEGA